MLPCENSLAGRVSASTRCCRIPAFRDRSSSFSGSNTACWPSRRDHRRSQECPSHSVALGQVRRILADLHLTRWTRPTRWRRQPGAGWGKRKTPPSRPPGCRDLWPANPRATWKTPRTNTRASTSSRKGGEVDPATPNLMTTFVFARPPTSAALYKALGGFATNGVNMTKLESYMMGASSPRPSSCATSRATRTHRPAPRVGELSFFSTEVRVLGVIRWPRSVWRKGQAINGRCPGRTHDGWRKLILNRPAKLNAVNAEMLPRLLPRSMIGGGWDLPSGGADRGGSRLLRGTGTRG